MEQENRYAGIYYCISVSYTHLDVYKRQIQYRIGRCHPLKGNRKNQYAVDLVHPYRLVFEKVEDQIQIVSITEIIDYH